MSCDFYVCGPVCFYVSMAFMQLINICWFNLAVMIYYIRIVMRLRLT